MMNIKLRGANNDFCQKGRGQSIYLDFLDYTVMAEKA